MKKFGRGRHELVVCPTVSFPWTFSISHLRRRESSLVFTFSSCPVFVFDVFAQSPIIMSYQRGKRDERKNGWMDVLEHTKL